MASATGKSKKSDTTLRTRSKASRRLSSESKTGKSVPAKKTKAEEPALSAKDLRTISKEIETEFPKAVDDDLSRLVLLDIDPKRIHAYWNITLPQYTRALKKAGAATKILRFYLLPSEETPLHNALHAFDIEVQGLRNQQYIDLQQDRSICAAECGLRAPDGSFFPLVKSNIVKTPPAGRSSDYSWTTIDTRSSTTASQVPDTHLREDFSKGLPPPKQLHDTTPAGLPAGHKHQGTKPPEQKPKMHPRRIPKQDLLLDEAFIDGLIRQRMQIDTSQLLSPGTPGIGMEHTSAGTLPETISSFSPSSSTCAPGTDEQYTFTAELVIEGRVRPGVHLALHGNVVPIAMDGRFQIRQPLQHDAQLLKLLAELPCTDQPSREQGPVLTMSTAGKNSEELLFEIHASLHMYGNIRSTEIPSFFSTEIPVRPDGSFHVTRILPRGACILPELMASIRPSRG